MPVIAKDKADIEALVKDGCNLTQIAEKYDVARNTIKNFCQKYHINYGKKTAENGKNQQNTASLGHLPIQPMSNNPNTNTNLNQGFVPLPQSSDPSMLQYLLQMETNRANAAVVALKQKEDKYDELKDKYEDLRLEKKDWERDKRNAIEDAQKGAGLNIDKALNHLKEMPEVQAGIMQTLGSLVGSITSKTNAAPGLGSIDNSYISDLVSALKQVNDPEKIKQICTIAFTLINDSVLLEELMIVVKARSQQ